MTLRHRLLPGAALAWLLIVPAGLAQVPVVDLLPDDTLAVVSVQHGGYLPEDVAAELRQLDWSRAGDTLEKLVRSLGDDAAEFEEFGGLLDDLSPAAILDEVCSGLGSAFAAGDPSPGGFEAALGVGLNLTSPPLTAAIRLRDVDSGQVSRIHDALRACANDVREGEFSELADVTLYEFGTIYDPYFVTATESGLILVSTEPQAIAAAAERDRSGEIRSESLSPFETLDSEAFSFGLVLRTEPARQLVAALFQQGAPSGGTDAALAQRLRGIVETVDGFALRVSVDGEGFVQEARIGVDAEGPDRELARLLTCSGCRAASPYLAPADAVAVGSGPLQLEAAVRYADNLLADLAMPALGQMLIEETGIDLERDLLDWIGRDIYFVQLEHLDTDLRTLLYAPAQALVVPVADADQAEASLERLLGGLEEAWLETSPPGFSVALRDGSYRDVNYRRFQSSLNLDVAVGLVGQNLVVAMPAAAIEEIIDVYHGAPSITGERRYRAAQAAAPEQPVSLSYTDTPGSLRGLAEIFRVAAQPLAFALDVALTEALGFEAAAESYWQVEMNRSDAQPLQAGSDVEGDLQDSEDPAAFHDVYIDGYLSDLYRLEGIDAGDSVSVVMESMAFDTYLYLVDADGWIVAMNDDAPDTSRSELSFTAEPGTEYYVWATSWSGGETGQYRLQTVSEAAGEMPEAPAFAELLELLEMPALVLEAVAEGVGETTGYTVSDDQSLYGRTFTPFVR